MSRHPDGAGLSLGGWGQGEGSGIPPPELYLGLCCGVLGPCTPSVSTPSPCALSLVSEFSGWATVPAGSAVAVSDVTPGTGSEKNCPWILSAPAGTRRLGGSGGRRRGVPAGRQPGPLGPAGSLPARCQPHSKIFPSHSPGAAQSVTGVGRDRNEPPRGASPSFICGCHHPAPQPPVGAKASRAGESRAPSQASTRARANLQV